MAIYYSSIELKHRAARCCTFQKYHRVHDRRSSCMCHMWAGGNILLASRIYSSMMAAS